jgi:hypothetical protein
MGRAADIFGEQHRKPRRQQAVGDRRERRRVGRHRHRRLGIAERRQLDFGGERLLLQPGVVTHVDRALRLGHHRPVSAGEGIRHALDAAGLVIPFDVMADLLALDVGGVDPVDEGAAPALVHRAGGADDEDRGAIHIGVVDAHGRMQQSDHVVHDGDHRAAGRLGVAMGDLHGDLLMLAQQHRRAVAAVIDERVVQAAKARPGIERDIGKPELLDQVDDHIGLPAPLRIGLRRRMAGADGGLVHWQSPGVRRADTAVCYHAGQGASNAPRIWRSPDGATASSPSSNPG